MLPLLTFINQLNTEQFLRLENSLHEKLDFEHPALLIFNCLALNESKEQIIRETYLDPESYDKFSRFIYDELLLIYNLRPKSKVDELPAEAFDAAIYLSEESDKEAEAKQNRLVAIFNEMKTANIEHEATDLLNSLARLNRNSPLHTVYNYLFERYKNIQEVNQIAFETFQEMNKKMSLYSSAEDKKSLIKEIITFYKKLRTLFSKAENKTLEGLLLLAKTNLVVSFGQVQLLKEKKLTVKNLITQTKTVLSQLPFGLERHFMEQIFRTVIRSNYSNQNIILKKDWFSADKEVCHFYFPHAVISNRIEKEESIYNSKRYLLEDDFYPESSAQLSALSIKYFPKSAHLNRLI